MYMDDYIGIIRGSRKRWQQLRRVLLHSLDGLSLSEGRFREETQKGGACWATHHIILGWLVDMVRLKIELPPHLTIL